MDYQLIVSKEIHLACPEFVGAAVFITFQNTEFSAPLWQEIERFLADYRSRYTVDSIKEMPAIEATRQAYKRCGKDPSRYRPSSEALVRRTLQGKELYRVSTAVDLINLASIAYGYSIGGFDADKIQGKTLTLGIGREGESYEGIGRGPLNIQGLPVWRDDEGGIGTPTSDNERTKMSLYTTRLLAIVNGYDGNRQQVEACARFIVELAGRYAGGKDAQIALFEYTQIN
ncbi:MAG: hypothetical protein IJR87_05850 [Bacteroidaceae bacterium]|nr:hypothetical protein [Bacteroidaceae bacterium]